MPKRRGQAGLVYREITEVTEVSIGTARLTRYSAQKAKYGQHPALAKKIPLSGE
jgi:hypothetical protein